MAPFIHCKDYLIFFLSEVLVCNLLSTQLTKIFVSLNSMICACQLKYDVRVLNTRAIFGFFLSIYYPYASRYSNGVKKAFLTNAFLYDNKIVLISFQLHYIVCIVLCNGKIFAIF